MIAEQNLHVYETPGKGILSLQESADKLLRRQTLANKLGQLSAALSSDYTPESFSAIRQKAGQITDEFAKKFLEPRLLRASQAFYLASINEGLVLPYTCEDQHLSNDSSFSTYQLLTLPNYYPGGRPAIVDCLELARYVHQRLPLSALQTFVPSDEPKQLLGEELETAPPKR